jgi:hypothetical protein
LPENTGSLLKALKPKYKVRQAKALIRNAITPLDVRLEHQILIAAKTEASKNNPMYDPVMPPLSIVAVDERE